MPRGSLQGTGTWWEVGGGKELLLHFLCPKVLSCSKISIEIVLNGKKYTETMGWGVPSIAQFGGEDGNCEGSLHTYCTTLSSLNVFRFTENVRKKITWVIRKTQIKYKNDGAPVVGNRWEDRYKEKGRGQNTGLFADYSYTEILSHLGSMSDF